MVWQLVFAGADTNCEITEGYPQSLWDLSHINEPTLKALIHFWEPSTHHLHPKKVRAALYWYDFNL